MELTIDDAVAVLQRTPGALTALLEDLPGNWTEVDEGPETFSPLDVPGHLIDGEEHDWIPRARIILEHGEGRPFDPFDRFAFRERYAALDLGERLELFGRKRAENLAALREFELGPEGLARRGTHPELGAVTLGQLLATWVAHDLAHVAQVVRVMAKAYREAVGPWGAYLSILSR